MHALIQHPTVVGETFWPMEEGWYDTRSASVLRKDAVRLMYLRNMQRTSRVCQRTSRRCQGEGQKSGRTTSWARWNHVFTFGVNAGSRRSTTVLASKIERSFLIESADSSDTRLPNVMAKRNVTLNERSRSETEPRGSNGGKIRAL